MNDLIRRNNALTKTQNRYQGKPFTWGKYDCWKMARSHLVAMGRKPPKTAPYKSVIGARTSLKKMGFDNLEDMLDSFLVRIPPAAMLPGDIALMRGSDVFDAITICVGRKVLGWHDDAEVPVIIIPQEIKAAWRA